MVAPAQTLLPVASADFRHRTVIHEFRNCDRGEDRRHAELSAPLIMNFLVMPLFFLSGALFPLSQLPPALTVVMSLNPLSYGVDGVRGALCGAHHFPYVLDVAVLTIVIAVVTTIGSILFSQIEA